MPAVQVPCALCKSLVDANRITCIANVHTAKKFALDEVKEALKAAESSTGGNKVFLEG